jgi:protein-S-isoprenylcysteine O-methyltransferase Ste14
VAEAAHTGAPGHPGVLAPPPLIYGAALGAGLVLEALLPSPYVGDAVAVPVGIVLIVAGSALAFSFLRAFRRARTPIDVRRAASTLVTTGPYRITRNPGYLGMALAYAGIAALVPAPWAFVTLVAALIVVDRMVIAREERFLEGRFGDEYRRYKVRARRWI